MFNCECGKAYKFASGLSKHKERCDGGGNKAATTSHCPPPPPPSVVACGVACGGVGLVSDDDDDDITKSSFFTFPLTQLKPTANFSKEDLEMLEKRKQARLKAIQQSRIEEKQRNAAAAEKKKREALISTSAGLYENSSSHFQENVGNEEHNASINIKYVRTSQETRQVIDAVAAAANEYCHNQGLGRNNQNQNQNQNQIIEKDNKSSIDDDGDDYGTAGGGALAPATSVNSSGTTVFHHPSRTISIIEKEAGDDDMDESERIVTLEKMTYLVLALIQQNTKIQKENALLKAIISKIDPSKLE